MPGGTRLLPGEKLAFAKNEQMTDVGNTTSVSCADSSSSRRSLFANGPTYSNALPSFTVGAGIARPRATNGRPYIF